MLGRSGGSRGTASFDSWTLACLKKEEAIHVETPCAKLGASWDETQLVVFLGWLALRLVKLANESFSIQVAVGLIHKQEADGWPVEGCRGRRSLRLMQDFEEASGISCAPGTLSTFIHSKRTKSCRGAMPVWRVDGGLYWPPTLAGDGSDEKSSRREYKGVTNQVVWMRCYPPFHLSRGHLIYTRYSRRWSQRSASTLCERKYDKFRVKCGRLEGHLPHDLGRDPVVALHAKKQASGPVV
ncbi:hypothetical protein ACQKWADRAFT_281620 [Trichoderma austrokoningii]